MAVPSFLSAVRLFMMFLAMFSRRFRMVLDIDPTTSWSCLLPTQTPLVNADTVYARARKVVRSTICTAG